MAVPKKKNSNVRFKHSILKKELQKKVQKINLKKINVRGWNYSIHHSLNSLNNYKRKIYW